MTCRHVLSLIDAGLFSGYPPSHLDAAWAHAAGCPTCGPALATARTVITSLRTLAAPAAPVALKPTVMARISAVTSADPGTEAFGAAEPASVARVLTDRTVWAPVVGVATGMAALLAGYGTPGDMVRFWNRTGIVAGPAPETTFVALALMGALGIFVVGLLVPLRRGRPR